MLEDDWVVLVRAGERWHRELLVYLLSHVVRAHLVLVDALLVGRRLLIIITAARSLEVTSQAMSFAFRNAFVPRTEERCLVLPGECHREQANDQADPYHLLYVLIITKNQL